MRCRARLAIVFVLASCSSTRRNPQVPWTPAPADDLGAAVARVGDVPIFAQQVRAKAMQANTTARRALDDIVDSYLLAERARRSGLSPLGVEDPDVASAMVQRLIEVELEPSLRYEAVPDSALLPLYQRGRDAFVHGRLVEIGVLAIYTGARMQDKRRDERARAAHDLAQFLKQQPPKTLDEFSGIAHDKEWSSRGVVFKRFVQGPDRPLSKAVWDEVTKLRALGDTTRMVEDEDGFFVARYLDERPPVNITFEQARADLLAGYYERWRQQQFLEFSTKRMQLHHVEVRFDLLSQDKQGL